MSSCAERTVCIECSRCRQVQSHREQRRLLTLPNVLLVYVERGVGEAQLKRGTVLAENQLHLPMHALNLELTFVSCIRQASRMLVGTRVRADVSKTISGIPMGARLPSIWDRLCVEC